MASFCKTMPKNWLRVLNSTPHPAGYIFLRYLSVKGTPPEKPVAKGNEPQTNKTAASNNDQARNSREGTARTPSSSQKSTGEGGRVPEANADATTDTTKLELLISKS